MSRLAFQLQSRTFSSLVAFLLGTLILCSSAVMYHLSTVYAQGGPALHIANMDTAEDDAVTVPIRYRGNDNEIAAIVFSIDYDESCLHLDLTDADKNGRPDAIVPTVPAGLVASIIVDKSDTDGEIDVIIADYFPPFVILADTDELLTITFQPICQPPAGGMKTAAVNFSTSPEPSFGDISGQSVDGAATNGQVTVMSSQPAPTATPTVTPTPTIVPTTKALTPTPTPTLIATALPVTIIESFTAELHEDGVLLEWRTSSEAGTKSFTVRRLDLGQSSVFIPISDPVAAKYPQGGNYKTIDTDTGDATLIHYLLFEEKASGRPIAHYDLLIEFPISRGSNVDAHQIHIPVVRH